MVSSLSLVYEPALDPMASVLLVSKPVVPPWNDSSKNLARDVADGMLRHTPRVIGEASGTWRPARGTVDVVHPAPSPGFSPPLAAQVRLLAHLALSRRPDLWHFFFAPNPRTSLAAKVLSRARRIPTVHTVCSRPRDLERATQTLFATRTVVLSRTTFEALRGVGARGLVHIPPAVPPLDVPTEEARRAARAHFDLPPGDAIILFPGDLEHGEGARRMIDAYSRMKTPATLVMACRAKTARAQEAERTLRAACSDAVRWIGETPRIHDLLGAADVVALPSSDLFAKMDLPLVLIEAMWLARPVVVAADSPAAELAEGGGARAVEPTPEALAASLDALLLDDGDRTALGARAREVAQERYHPRAMVDAYEALYDRVLEENR